MKNKAFFSAVSGMNLARRLPRLPPALANAASDV